MLQLIFNYDIINIVLKRIKMRCHMKNNKLLITLLIIIFIMITILAVYSLLIKEQTFY